MQVINNRAVFDTVNKFAIGLSKDVLLVQRATATAARGTTACAVAFLIHRAHIMSRRAGVIDDKARRELFAV